MNEFKVPDFIAALVDVWKHSDLFLGSWLS